MHKDSFAKPVKKSGQHVYGTSYVYQQKSTQVISLRVSFFLVQFTRIKPQQILE